jgi:molybdate transport system substrate-binding protein
VFVLLLGCGEKPEGVVQVFAAASTGDLMRELVTRYERDHHIRIKLSLAASSTLARQIDSGARADLFLSANDQWMVWLAQRGHLDETSRKVMMGNRLVVIAHHGNGHSEPFSFEGRLALGDPSHVPAGIYGKQALQNLGYWDNFKDRLAPAAHVRDALRWVALGECERGVVYATDARADDRITVLRELSQESHEAIVYPLALMNEATIEAREFYDFLLSDEAKAVAVSLGFVRVNE